MNTGQYFITFRHSSEMFFRSSLGWITGNCHRADYPGGGPVSAIDDRLAEASALPGARLAVLFDYGSGLPIGVAGEDTLTAEEDATGTADLIQRVLMTPAISAAQGGDTLQEVIVVGTAGTHVILLADGSLCLHVVFDPGVDLGAVRGRLRDVLHRLVSAG
jgi:predicted regulator of Ras-like GTPase activity (Roadblock/LC7/MglB family)